MSKLPKLVPLGSAVRIKDTDDKQVYVVIGRAFMDAQTSGYQAVAYPWGYGENYRIHIFRESELEIVLSGYENEKEERFFIQERLAEMEKRQSERPSPVNTQDEEVLGNNILSNEERLKEDPFYKFRKVD